jgi:hypothetical protein
MKACRGCPGTVPRDRQSRSTRWSREDGAARPGGGDSQAQGQLWRGEQQGGGPVVVDLGAEEDGFRRSVSSRTGDVRLRPRRQSPEGVGDYLLG